MSLVLAADYRVPDFAHTVQEAIETSAPEPPTRIPGRLRRRWGRSSSRDRS